jgi:hypothetical protein
VFLAEDFLSKILIHGNQNTLGFQTDLQNLIIVDTTRLIEYRKYIMSLFLQPTSHTGTGAFVNEKTHLLLDREWHKINILKGAIGKEEASMDIFLSQARILGQNIFDGISLG